MLQQLKEKLDYGRDCVSAGQVKPDNHREVRYYMKYHSGVLAVLSTLLLAGCASKQPPKPDPLREEVTVLQKQLLELQLLQQENSSAIATLSGKVRSLEERQAGRRSAPSSASGKKTAPKRKKVRRQE